MVNVSIDVAKIMENVQMVNVVVKKDIVERHQHIVLQLQDVNQPMVNVLIDVDQELVNVQMVNVVVKRDIVERHQHIVLQLQDVNQPMVNVNDKNK